MVNQLTVRVPPFWPDDPALWFIQLEGQFQLNRITSDATKYHNVVGNLDPQFSTEVRDILSNPPATDMYRMIGISPEVSF